MLIIFRTACAFKYAALLVITLLNLWLVQPRPDTVRAISTSAFPSIEALRQVRPCTMPK